MDRWLADLDPHMCHSECADPRSVHEDPDIATPPSSVVSDISQLAYYNLSIKNLLLVSF